MLTQETDTLERIQKEDSIESVLLNKNRVKPKETGYNTHQIYTGYQYSTEEVLQALERQGYRIVPFYFTDSDFGGHRNQAILNLSEDRLVVVDTMIKTFCALKRAGDTPSFDNIFYKVAYDEFGASEINGWKPKLQ